MLVELREVEGPNQADDAVARGQLPFAQLAMKLSLWKSHKM
jgi:hypothetical protein